MSTDGPALATRLAQASDHLVVPPGLLADVRRGGLRRLRRRRIGAAVGCAAAVAGVVLAVPAFSPHRQGAVQGLSRAVTSTGSLPADAAYRAAALAAWDASHASSANASRGIFEHLVGPARIVWAGSTPAGPAAVVQQDADLRPHDDLSPDDFGPRTLYGYLGVDAAARPVVVADDYRAKGVPAAAGWFVDPSRSVLAVLTQGRSYGVSTSWTYGADGTARRAPWLPVPAGDGGVGVLRVPAGADVRLALQPFRGFDDLRRIANAREIPTSVDRRLPWAPGSRLRSVRHVGRPGTTPSSDGLDQAFNDALDARSDLASFLQENSLWFVEGTVPDGRRLTVGERELDGDPSHAYALLGGTVIGAGPIDPAAVLPIVVRLPDGQGVVVAAYGSGLRWRHAGSAWQTAGRDAALLPAGRDLEVQVTRAGSSQVVPLG